MYTNPVIPGFHPDPSVCRVGEDYYLVTSSFEWFPGVPIFHSRDLVHWRQLGHVLDRPSQLDLDGVRPSGGIYAPTIRHHDGVFYMITTLMDEPGNFLVTATDPAGPWSDPVWFPGTRGFDPSLFFDDDGRAWMTGTRLKDAGRYEGDSEIWLREFDPATLKPFGEEHVIWEAAQRGGIWCEGPHIYRIGAYYYLLTSEGGTAEDHAVMVARAERITGPYLGNPRNPVLTHRHLGLRHPVTSVGHPDLVRTAEGEWWSVLLATRPYGALPASVAPVEDRPYGASAGSPDGLSRVSSFATRSHSGPAGSRGESIGSRGEFADDHGESIGDQPTTAAFRASRGYNLGRETFLTRVRWEDDWPVFDQVEPYAQAPSTPARRWPATPACDHFDTPRLAPEWNHLRTPREPYWSLADSRLTLRVRPQTLRERAAPSLVARRQRHIAFAAHTVMEFRPEGKECAGLVLFQNDDFHITLVLTAHGLELTRRSGGTDTLLVRADVVPSGPLWLGVEAHGQDYQARYALRPGEWTDLAAPVDGRVLGSTVAGGFTGAMIGLYASSNGHPSTNTAAFDWFEYLPLLA
ncbi:glycoside hydrolase family 43 protein [Streptosporangium sp. NBC_01495]|uniref:glycoside hydrolase family 43 protein n=1 Tax=Streptosporangium sp. NBC_01495 TaxID=2903899 RepID=UPI002E361F57|nr:glycoside hydrolase family 43 protein [Streptosporangium sp. NBC_01495]